MKTLDSYFFSGSQETYTTINATAAVDATSIGVGLVTITSTDHGFKAGATAELPTNIFVSGTVNYDGLRKIHAVTTDTITIFAAYVAETFAGTETLRTMFSDSSPFILAGFKLHLDTAAATVENLSVNVDADRGAAFDINLYTKAMNTVQDIVFLYDEPLLCRKNDKIDLTWANTDNRLWGISVLIEQ